MISIQNLSHFEPVEKRSIFMKSIGYLDFDESFFEVGVIHIGSFSKHMECDLIYPYTYATEFFLKLWYDFSRKLLA